MKNIYILLFLLFPVGRGFSQSSPCLSLDNLMTYYKAGDNARVKILLEEELAKGARLKINCTVSILKLLGLMTYNDSISRSFDRWSLMLQLAPETELFDLQLPSFNAQQGFDSLKLSLIAKHIIPEKRPKGFIPPVFANTNDDLEAKKLKLIYHADRIAAFGIGFDIKNAKCKAVVEAALVANKVIDPALLLLYADLMTRQSLESKQSTLFLAGAIDRAQLYLSDNGSMVDRKSLLDWKEEIANRLITKTR